MIRHSTSSVVDRTTFKGLAMPSVTRLFALYVTLSFASAAAAGILVSSNSTGLIKGTTPVAGTAGILGEVDAEVDWSVFAPGTGFQTFLTDNGLALAESFSADNYVYAYQVSNIDSSAFSSPTEVSTVTVGIDRGDPVIAGSIGSLSTAGGDALPPAAGTSFVGVLPDDVSSAAWSYIGSDGVGVGGQSGLLYFASPYQPEFDNVAVSAASATIMSLGTVTSGEPAGPGVPSPGSPGPGGGGDPTIPEPTSVMILGLVASTQLLRRASKS